MVQLQNCLFMLIKVMEWLGEVTPKTLGNNPMSVYYDSRRGRLEPHVMDGGTLRGNGTKCLRNFLFS